MASGDSKKKKTLGSKKVSESVGIGRISSSVKNIRENSPVPSPYAQQLYTLDDLIDVWCRGCTNGATLWQYCQDNNFPLPSSFEAGLLELVNQIRESGDKGQALQALLSNNMMLLGVFDEIQ